MAFPDLKLTVGRMIAEGDLVAVPVSIQRTRKGGFMDIAATGNRLATRGVDRIRIADGKATELWHDEEKLSFCQQPGVTVMPGAQEWPARQLLT